MIRKTTVSMLLIAIVALALLMGLAAPVATSHSSSAFHTGSSFIANDQVPTPTPASSDSGVSGGGNGGG